MIGSSRLSFSILGWRLIASRSADPPQSVINPYTTNWRDLMGGSFKIGRFSGIDVKIHWTFLLLLAFFAFLGYQTSGSVAGALTPIAVIVALFLCVLLHEFGHSLVAQRLGIEIHSITLLPIGGVSNLESIPEKPSDEVKITLAGPLVNVVLVPIFFGVGLLLGAEPGMPTDLFTGIGSVGQFFFYLGYLNVVLALFNLIPAFPLDGGRVLRGLLATRLGALRRLMCNSGQQRRSPDRMLHQTLSKGWCRHGSGLLLGLIVRARGRLVEARSRFAAAEDWSACPAQRLGGPHPGHPRPVAALPQREGLLALRLGASALLLPYPLFAEPAQPAHPSPGAGDARFAAGLRLRARRAFGRLSRDGHDPRPGDGAGEGFS